jgi:hypothetical protein
MTWIKPNIAVANNIICYNDTPLMKVSKTISYLYPITAISYYKGSAALFGNNSFNINRFMIVWAPDPQVSDTQIPFCFIN